MSSDRFQRIRGIAESALELDGSKRERYLSEACAGDAGLLGEVRAIVEGGEGETLIENIIRPELESVLTELPRLEGARIGRYRIVRHIGSGGMGAVYEAEQEEPRRSVALKTLGSGLLDPEAISRFRYEAEVLARLHHPGIAAIFEAGTHRIESGGGSIAVPFFAMEYVRNARTLPEYSKDQGLDIRQRLTLFCRMLDAIHYGHVNGIIHRDLKTGNILVDGNGCPKVIDFGVARASDVDASMRTQTGELVGTLQYMSPEQLQGRPEDVDIRSDLYALGAVLFQLLTGQTPHDLRGLTLTHVIRTVAEQAPRRMRSLDVTIPAELEWVTSKALEREKQRRYSSALELKDDLQRFLRHEPVHAGPPSTAYRLLKFTRRNWLGVAIAALFLLTLMTGLVLVFLGLQREKTQRQRVEASSRFMSEMFEAVSPERQGVDVRVLDMLEAASVRLQNDPPEQPLVHADILFSLGAAYTQIGDSARAEAHLEQALGIRERELPADDAELFAVVEKFGRVLHINGKSDRAEPYIRRALEHARETLGEEAFLTVDLICFLSGVVSDQGRLEEAFDLALEAYRIRPPSVDPPDYLMIRVLDNYAQRCDEMKQLEESKRAYHALIAVRAGLSGLEHPALPNADFDLRTADPFAADPEHAIEVILAVLERLEAQSAQKTNQRELFDCIAETNNFGHYYLAWGDPEQGLRLFEGLLEPATRLQGDDGHLVNFAHMGMGKANLMLNRPDQAGLQFRTVIASREAVLGPRHRQTQLARRHLVDALWDAGDWLALEIELGLLLEDVDFEQTEELLKHATLATLRGVALKKLKRYEPASDWLTRAHEIYQQHHPDHHNATWPIIELAKLYVDQGLMDQAREWNSKVPEEYRLKLPEESR